MSLPARPLQPCTRRAAQRGQALVEYIVVASVLATALFTFEFGGKTGAQYLADMIRAFFRSLSYFISLP